jgi:hypothetical protein
MATITRQQNRQMDEIISAATAAKTKQNTADLLYALKDITRHASLFHKHEFSALIAQAKDAIAKAEGLELAKAIEGKVAEVIKKNQRPGGFLNPNS